MTQLETAVQYVKSRVLRVSVAHPVRVAIDGFCAAGKSTFAQRLGAALLAEGRSIIRATTDDFQNPPEIRWQLGPDSPEGFYRHAIDFAALRRELLDPLGPGGTRAYRTSVYDLHARHPKLSPIAMADVDSIAIVDGLFLHVRELRSYWDYSVFVDAALDICVGRALRRNQEGQADPAELERTYRTRYMPGFTLYMSEAAPQQVASFVVHNSGSSSPTGAG